MVGGKDNDSLSGDAGNDLIYGNLGNDTFGEAGTDSVFVFVLAEGDRVQLDPGTQYAQAQVGADTVISMRGGGQMILVGMQMTSLTGAWIFGN